MLVGFIIPVNIFSFNPLSLRIDFSIWSLKLSCIICMWCSPSAVADANANRRSFELTAVNPNSQEIWRWFDLKRIKPIHSVCISLPTRSNWGDFFHIMLTALTWLRQRAMRKSLLHFLHSRYDVFVVLSVLWWRRDFTGSFSFSALNLFFWQSCRRYKRDRGVTVFACSWSCCSFCFILCVETLKSHH